MLNGFLFFLVFVGTSAELGSSDYGIERNHSCLYLNGVCISNRKTCPKYLSQETQAGSPICGKNRRCCYPEKTNGDGQKSIDIYPMRQLVDDTEIKVTRGKDCGKVPKPKCSTKTKCQKKKGFCQKKIQKCFGKKIKKACNCNNDCICCVSTLTLPTDCVWNWNSDFPNIKPIIINVEDTIPKIVHPSTEENGGTETRVVRIPINTKLRIACPGSRFTNFATTSIKARCNTNSKLDLEGIGDRTMSNMGCAGRVKSTTRIREGICAPLGDTSFATYESQIGFDISNDMFYPLIKICYDWIYKKVIWTKHIIRGRGLFKNINENIKENWYGLGTLEVFYTQKHQEEMMKSLNLQKYFKNPSNPASKEWWFAKGHMAARADFITTAEQEATYYYINSIPQWQVVNNGNWKHIEHKTRILSINHGTDLWVLNGAIDAILMLDGIQIYLNERDPAFLPAPARIWKIVYEKFSRDGLPSNKGVAFVTNNNPHLSLPASILPSDKDICDRLTGWIDVERIRKIPGGYTNCYTIADLRSVIPNIPLIGTEPIDILLN